ncbi:winged helix DNA-binding protein [Tianweitania aestuarii]|nr:winged helix DNA-binding protein [Tianweitania aestuarii]
MRESRSSGRSLGPIVSSQHLAAGTHPGLSEMEYGVILISHAFSRWMVRCMTAAGQPGLSPIEILILHSVRHRSRPKTLADVCLALDIGDTHVANYAIRKLEKAGLIHTGRAGKEKTVRISDTGLALCDRYAEIRNELLVRGMSDAGPSQEEMSRIASVLRFLSGSYDQASRAAATV